VFVEGERITKPGYRVDPGTRVILKKDPIPYVGRGGMKLKWALDVFAIETSGRIALDVGASTGGFTDCLLSRGVRKVFAVDVGYGQLAWTLRTDPRVVVMERTNARYLTPRSLSEHVHLATSTYPSYR
jgi:23S rRNA (cytidine1920-2'-O)/16S rRNA (cytidine1409-2'-O)-methyltransferase